MHFQTNNCTILFCNNLYKQHYHIIIYVFSFFFKLSYLDNRPVAPETTITLNGYQNGEPERDLEKYFKSLQGNLYCFIIYACLH